MSVFVYKTINGMNVSLSGAVSPYDIIHEFAVGYLNYKFRKEVNPCKDELISDIDSQNARECMIVAVLKKLNELNMTDAAKQDFLLKVSSENIWRSTINVVLKRMSGEETVGKINW